MNQTPLLTRRIEEIDPECIIVVHPIRKDTGVLTSYEPHKISGRFYRVFPRNWADVFFLQCLAHRVHKWAPAHGEGVLVEASRLEAPNLLEG